MSLRQREWVIYIRSYRVSSGTRLFDTGSRVYGSYPMIGMSSGQGNAEGGVDGSATMDTGSWTMWYAGTSFKLLREKYKELLKSTPRENIRVLELIDVDTMITPIS